MWSFQKCMWADSKVTVVLINFKTTTAIKKNTNAWNIPRIYTDLQGHVDVGYCIVPLLLKQRKFLGDYFLQINRINNIEESPEVFINVNNLLDTKRSLILQNVTTHRYIALLKDYLPSWVIWQLLITINEYDIEIKDDSSCACFVLRVQITAEISIKGALTLSYLDLVL